MGDIMYTVDRIEEKFVVLENSDKSFINIRKELFPENIKDGDIVKFVDDKYVICKDETNKKNKEIREKFDSLIK